MKITPTDWRQQRNHIKGRGLTLSHSSYTCRLELWSIEFFFIQYSKLLCSFGHKFKCEENKFQCEALACSPSGINCLNTKNEPL